jgi:hypothetical protein
MPPGTFRFRGEGRLAEWMVKAPLGLEDAVGANSLGNADERRDGHHWNAAPFDFFGQRSAATRTRPSRRGQDYRLDALCCHILRHFGADTSHGLDIRHVTGGDVKVIVEPSNHAFLL